MKFVKKYTFIFVVSLLIVVMNEGCDLVPPDNLVVKLELQPSITVPMTSTYKVSISKFLNDLSNSSSNRIYTDPTTNVMTYSLTSNVALLSLEDILNTSYSFRRSAESITPPGNGITVPNDITFPIYEDTIAVRLGDGNVQSKEVKRISIAEGKLTLTVSPKASNGDIINMKITLGFPTIKTVSGSPLSIEIPVKSAQSVSVEQLLNQSVISLIESNNTGSIPVTYSQTVYKGSKAILYDIISQIRISKIEWIEGSFSETVINISTKPNGKISGIFKISELLTNIDAKIFSLYDAKIKYKVKNTLGVNMVLDVNTPDDYSYYSSKNDQRTGAKFIYEENTNFMGLAALGRFNSSSPSITETITSLPVDFITNDYDEISYNFGLIFEPSRLAHHKQPLNIIRFSDSVAVISEIIIPFKFEITDLTHTVSFNSNFSASSKSIADYVSSTDTSSVFLYIENTIPLSVAAQIYFIDESNIAIDSLFKSPTTILESTKVDDNGFSTDVRVGQYKIDITKSQLTSLLSCKNVKVKVYVNHNKSNLKKISIRESDYISIRSAVNLKGNVNLIMK